MGIGRDESTKHRSHTKVARSKALFFIQQAIHDTMFVKIAAAETAKEAWTILKTTF
jgi:hypothetical protein